MSADAIEVADDDDDDELEDEAAAVRRAAWRTLGFVAVTSLFALTLVGVGIWIGRQPSDGLDGPNGEDPAQALGDLQLREYLRAQRQS